MLNRFDPGQVATRGVIAQFGISPDRVRRHLSMFSAAERRQLAAGIADTFPELAGIVGATRRRAVTAPRTAADRAGQWREFLAERDAERERERSAAQARARSRAKRERAMEFLTGHRRPDLVRRYRSARLGAYHEAGHIVAAWVLCHDVVHARVDPDGHCGYTGLSGRTDARESLVILWAGFAAESAHPDFDPEFSQLWPEYEDHVQFERVAAGMDPFAGKVAAGLAVRIVGQQYRRQVATVADALGWSGALDASELAKLRAACMTEHESE